MNCDIRADVFERVVSRGKTLLSLSSNRASLEQIFLRLTEAADNDEVRRMLGMVEEPVNAEVPESLTEIPEETETLEENIENQDTVSEEAE